MKNTVLKKDIMNYKDLNLIYIPMFKKIYLFRNGKRLGEFKNSQYEKAKKTFYAYKREMVNNEK